jgi:hypothetical protein
MVKKSTVAFQPSLNTVAKLYTIIAFLRQQNFYISLSLDLLNNLCLNRGIFTNFLFVLSPACLFYFSLHTNL